MHFLRPTTRDSAWLLLAEYPALSPDLIFLDLNMPKLSGRHCLAMIKKMVRHKHTPVIICTTSASETDMDETWELGAACYLTKPPTVADWKYELSEVLSSFLEINCPADCLHEKHPAAG